MLEYVFFHPIPFEQFVDFLKDAGLEPETATEDESYEVFLPEDIDDELSKKIEVRYDELMDVNRQLFESTQPDDSENYHAAGVVLNLKDGQTLYADVDPLLLSRIMGVLTAEEFGRVVNAIVDAVENPDTRSFCQKMRDGDE